MTYGPIPVRSRGLRTTALKDSSLNFLILYKNSTVSLKSSRFRVETQGLPPMTSFPVKFQDTPEPVSHAHESGVSSGCFGPVQKTTGDCVR